MIEKSIRGGICNATHWYVKANKKYYFKWIEKTYLNDIFLKLMLNIPQNYMNFIVTCHSYYIERNLEKPKSLLLTYKIKLNILFA